ncbi:uncharacterized protein LOC110869591 [Helianthus annuus]|uniref:uncharacterized protein LOC110869591 n=1 Tax=Helianthus annuus TaxID=4232 RepID=UPI000B8F9E53|nr:uncharacterized protein LOC110869591 [Helianthus annuus]
MTTVTRQQELERVEKMAKDNTVLIQTQQVILEDNATHIRNLQVQMTEMCAQLREMKEIMNNNRRGERNGDNRLVRVGRLDFPRFNGEDVEGWIYKCNHFFAIDKTPDEHKVQVAVVNLEGAALQWHQAYAASQDQLVEDMIWEDYVRSIENRFSNRLNEEPIEELKNLQQTGSLQEYCEAFDALLNRVKLCEEYAAGLFVAGIKPEVRCLVKMFKPKTVIYAIAMAKQQELVYTTLIDNKEVKKPMLSNSYQGNNARNTSTSMVSYYKSNTLPANNTNTLSLLPTPPASKMVKPIRKISTKETEEKRARGECFWCPEKYTSTHNCKYKQLYVLQIENDELEESDSNSSVIEVQEMEGSLQISLNAILGIPSYNTMRIVGTIGTKQLQILVDSGSTHNFLNEELARRLQCPTIEVPSLSVAVADGNKMSCVQLCQNFQWMMQGVWYKSDVLLLPLKNYDMVLGIQWLSTLGDISWNFKELIMKFSLGNNQFELKGTNNQGLTLVSLEKMWEGFENGNVQAEMFSMQTKVDGVFQHQAKISNEVNDEVLNGLLDEFKDVFEEPTALPPRRSCDHRIKLIDETKAINQRAYRYPVGQKDVIEKMVQEMKEMGIIQDSVSEFASPVVLVKKKMAIGGFVWTIEN